MHSLDCPYQISNPKSDIMHNSVLTIVCIIQFTVQIKLFRHVIKCYNCHLETIVYKNFKESLNVGMVVKISQTSRNGIMNIPI